MESRKVFPSFGQFRQNLGHFNKATWPAMKKEKRDGVLDCAWLMDEMNVICAVAIYPNLCCILRKLIQFGFHLTPVEFIALIVNKSLNIGQW